tara:strand:+ start:4694 stop:6160 length:1467 start_codon:yes stop_codon:yes gene_type:complete
MLFNSIEFIVFFVLVLAIISALKYKKFQHIFLLISSYVFFYFSSNILITLLIFSTVLDFYAGKAIFNSKSIRRKKFFLIISLSGNLGLLGFFKYADFGIQQFNTLANSIGISELYLLNLALPIGISFYTFQTISYTVDIYRGHLKPSKTLKEFALFVSFFPQLVAGPIVRAKDFLPQLREKFDNASSNGIRQIILQNPNLKIGITIMSLGFFKKMFFADNIAPLVNDIFANPIGLDSFTIILGAIGFGIQIYCDFSGYSDIAIGVALILGFKLPMNFNKPYFATSPSDFWKRWHISLSSWLRDYLYIPLGGNKKSSGRIFLNLMTVMFLGGLWHGASWNFVIWGILHGIYLSIDKILQSRFSNSKYTSFFKTKSGKIISILITQYLIFLTWIPFRVNDFDGIVYSMQKYVFLDFQISETIFFITSHKLSVAILILFLVFHFIIFRKQVLIEKLSKLNPFIWCLFLFSIFLSILILYDGNPENFIYFKF